MNNFMDYISDRITETENMVAKTIGLLGGLTSMYLFMFPKIDIDQLAAATSVYEIILFAWGSIWSTLIVLATSGGTTIFVLFATDVYKWLKPKAVKYLKAKLVIQKARFQLWRQSHKKPPPPHI